MSNATQKTERQNLAYKFTEPELVILAKSAAEKQSQLKALEDGRKMVADEWKAKISACQSEITNLSNKISSGIEYRDYECPVKFDTPKKGYKSLYHPETGELVTTKEMTASEIRALDEPELIPAEKEAPAETGGKPFIVEEEPEDLDADDSDDDGDGDIDKPIF